MGFGFITPSVPFAERRIYTYGKKGVAFNTLQPKTTQTHWESPGKTPSDGFHPDPTKSVSYEDYPHSHGVTVTCDPYVLPELSYP
ncbi:hypothetical protein CEB3_c08310 [Peptococcaceae bacterium CEB3]|nr:hypothetical protein CEB3_c08310 [Peptococcaceae bacterium CEB3]